MRNNFPPREFSFTLLVLFFSIFFSITAGEGCLTLMMLCGGINTITRSAYLAFIKIKLKLPQTRSEVVCNYRFLHARSNGLEVCKQSFRILRDGFGQHFTGFTAIRIFRLWIDENSFVFMLLREISMRFE